MAPRVEGENLMGCKSNNVESNPKSQQQQPRYKNTVHLWEFLLELLADDRCTSLINWSRQSSQEFKLKDKEEVARRWGMLKGKEGMNYEKLSRALRYYYRLGIIKKVPGQRLVYKFNKLPYKYVPGVTRSSEQVRRIRNTIHIQDQKARMSVDVQQFSASPSIRTPLVDKSCSWPIVPMPFQALSWFPGDRAEFPPFLSTGSQLFFPLVESIPPRPSGSCRCSRQDDPSWSAHKPVSSPGSIPVSVITSIRSNQTKAMKVISFP